MGTSQVIQLAEGWCEIAVLDVEPETSDPNSSQPLTTS